MAIYQAGTVGQTATEIRQWTADFTDDLALGVTISGGTAVHTPPYGTALTATVTVDSPYVIATLGAGLVAGQHYLDVRGTLSNSEVHEIRIGFTVNYPASGMREGMAAIIAELRTRADAGPGDYTVGGVPYWTDQQLQDVLDKRRNDLKFQETAPMPDYQAAFYKYYEFKLPAEWCESGTALSVVDAIGNAYGTATYTFDQARSVVTFASDMRGQAVLVNAHSYDINAAAADVWRKKASHYATAYDLTTDNHSLKRSQLIAQCLQMAAMYDGLGGPSSIHMERSDNVPGW